MSLEKPEKKNVDAEQLEQLAEYVVKGEETFAEARVQYQKLVEEKQHLQALLDASQKPRNDISNVAHSKRLDEVEDEINRMDKDFFNASAEHGVARDNLDEGIKSKLN